MLSPAKVRTSVLRKRVPSVRVASEVTTSSSPDALSRTKSNVSTPPAFGQQRSKYPARSRLGSGGAENAKSSASIRSTASRSAAENAPYMARASSLRSVGKADPPVEARGRVDVEHANGTVAVVAEPVLDPGGHEHEGSRRGRHLAVAERERHLALQDVERVVLAVVDVLLEHAPGRDLDDPEGEPRRVGGAREELDVAEPVPLAGRDDDGIHGADPARVKGSAPRLTGNPAHGNRDLA